MCYKIEDINDDNDDNEYEYLDEVLHFLDEEEDEDVIQDVINQTIEEHEKEELNKPYIICSECNISSKPIYLVKFKPVDNVQKEKYYCIVCLIDLKYYNSSSIVSYKEIKQD